jgi:hypothetical protein
MGNNTSSSNSNKSAEKEFDNFYDIIDYIATYYILTMDFKSLSKLIEKEYCDKLIVLTSDIIKRYFNDMEITYLAQRVKNGLEVNDLSKEKVVFVNKDQLETLDISNDSQKSIKKKRICIGIAKFYIKIAHIFAAIVMTINPVYTYKDTSGQTVKTGLMEKDTIPKNSNRKLFKLNICDNRIRALKKGEQLDTTSGNVTMQPNVCDININKTGQLKNLSEEPGIPELLTLYFDDNYDYSNGTFTGMSDTTKKQFTKDLKTFYTAFTGNQNMPPEITKFSDIKLRDFNNIKGCQGETPILKNKYVINKNEKLFAQYAKNTQKMIQNAADNQSKLLEVINELFTYVIDPYNGKQKIRVNPNLTEESLQKTVEKTRKLIVDLYVKCEMDYVTGIKIYEAIVESKILDTTQKQIQTLQKEANKIIDETTQIVSTPSPPLIQAPINPIQAPVNPIQAPINPIQAPVNPIQAPVNPIIQPFVNNTNITNEPSITTATGITTATDITTPTQDLYNPINKPIVELNKKIEAKNNILESLSNEVNETPAPNLNANTSTSITTSDVTNIPTAQNNVPPKYAIPIN